MASKEQRSKKAQHIASGPMEASKQTSNNRQSGVLANILASLGLGDAPRDSSTESLLSLLQTGEWEERATAARLLGKSDDESIISVLIERLQNDKSAKVRAAIVYALGELAKYTPAQPILEAMGDENKFVRAAAAWALGEMGERLQADDLLPLFAAIYDQDEDTYVRVAALRSLGVLGDRVPIEWIVDALEDPDWQVRQVAALILGQQEERIPVERLEALLDDEDDMVCRAAAQALGQIWKKTAKHLSDTSIAKDAENTLLSDEKDDSSTPGGESSQSPSIEVVSTHVHVNNADDIDDTSEKRHFIVGDVEFDGIEPGDFTKEEDNEAVAIPVVAQALDNQWMTIKLSKAIFQGKLSYQDATTYLEGLVRTEYIRALINGDRVVINRAFLYNNPVLFSDYLQPGTSQTVFKQFLEKGTIIPFLLYEHSPDEVPAFGTNMDGFSAWQRICKEVNMQCIRFSWDDKTHRRLLQQFTAQFHGFATTIETTKDIPKLIEDLGLSLNDTQNLKTILAKINNISTKHYRDQDKKGEKNLHITRNILYQKFVTAGPNPAERIYDNTKPFAGEVKQLLDLAYNGHLADALNGYLLTPIDSPTRAILQEWDTARRQKVIFTGEELMKILRSNAFRLVQEALYLKSMGLLTLYDVQQIRNTEEWYTYIRSLQRLLKAPGLFIERAPEVYSNYVGLAKMMTDMIEKRDHALTAPWNASVKVLATVGGASLSVVWNKDGVFYAPQGEPYVISNNGDAPFNMRLIIGESGASGSSNQAKLFTSIEIIKGKMPDAIREWGKMMRAFGKDRQFQEYSLDRVREVNVPTINEPVQ